MIRRIGAILVAVALVLSIGLVPGVALAEDDNDCVRYGQGYWKQWLADEENGDVFDLPGHSNEDLLAILNTPARGGNADVILSYQFIAATLNVEVVGCEMPQTVQDAFDEAKDHLHDEDSEPARSEILGWKDILEFWNENQYAELVSVVYEGTCTLFGSHIDDKITFTFSNDVFHDPNVEISFESATRLWEGWGADEWTMDGNTATVTLKRLYGSPRDIIGDKVVGIKGIVDFIGEPVVIPEGGVEVEAVPVTTELEGTFTSTRDVPGEWSYEVTINTICDEFDSGTISMTDPDGEVIEATILDLKHDYKYWYELSAVSKPNLGAVGTATYDGYEGNFMFLIANSHIWMALSQEGYDVYWEAGTVWPSGDRDYDIWGTNPDPSPFE